MKKINIVDKIFVILAILPWLCLLNLHFRSFFFQVFNSIRILMYLKFGIELLCIIIIWAYPFGYLAFIIYVIHRLIRNVKIFKIGKWLIPVFTITFLAIVSYVLFIIIGVPYIFNMTVYGK